MSKRIYRNSFIALLFLMSTNLLGQTVFDSIQVVVGTIDGISNIETADINEDGLPDILYASTNDYNAKWYSNSESGVFNEEAISFIDGTLTVTTADINSNGHQDIIYGSTRNLSLYENDGAGNLSAPFTFETVSGGSKMVAANFFDDDNEPELLVLDNGARELRIYDGISEGAVSETIISPQPIGYFDDITALEAADFNNDGFLEIYLHFNNDFSMIPKEWKAQGIQSKRVILDFKNNNLNCKDY